MDEEDEQWTHTEGFGETAAIEKSRDGLQNPAAFYLATTAPVMTGDSNTKSKKRSTSSFTCESFRGRCNWNGHEERIFIIALKEIVANGWRSENGWKPGYMTALEQAFVKLCPGTNKRANPHMHSKMGTFKRNYNMLVDCIGKSGGGFDCSTNTFDATPELWAELKQHDPATYTILKNKTWPYYRDWLEIFGKDRANGEFVEDGDVTDINQRAYASNDAADEDPLLDSMKKLIPYPSSNFEEADKYSRHDDSFNDDEDASYGTEQGYQKSRKKKSKSCDDSSSEDGKKRRKLGKIEFDGLISELRELSKESNAAIKKLGETLIRPNLVLNERKKMASEFIRAMTSPMLTIVERLKVVQVITRDPALVDLFLDSSVSEREIIVGSIARGEM